MTGPTRLLTYDLPDSGAVDFAVKLTGAFVGDVSATHHGDTVLVVFKAPGELDNSVYALTPDNQLTRLFKTANGKDGTAAVVPLPDGRLLLFVAEADEIGQSGGTAGVWFYDLGQLLSPVSGDADNARVDALEHAINAETLTRKQADAWLRDKHLLSIEAQAIIRAAAREEIRAVLMKALE